VAVITISRQMGSDGDYIADLLASMLSYNLVNKQSIIMEAHRRGMIDQKTVNGIGEGKPPLLERFIKHKSQAVYAMRSIMREAVSEGNAVVVGRGGNIELKDRADLLKVRIIAPLETRIARTRQESGMDRAQAVKMLKQSDKEQTEYVRHFFLADCSDPELYDIVINTGRISPDAAARLIVQLVRQVGGGRDRSAGN
jgi:cytidylate kinase